MKIYSADGLTDNIKNLSDGYQLKATAIVTAQCSRGLILTDNGGSILYYNPSIDLNSYPIGTLVDIEGQVSVYNRGFELKSDAVIEAKGTSDFTYPDPVNYTGGMIDEACTSGSLIKTTYVSLEGRMVFDNQYYNILIDGANCLGSVYYPTEEFSYQFNDGEDYIFYGYFISVAAQNYFYIVITDIERINQTFYDDGLYYSIDRKKGTCAVIASDYNLSGEVIIPSQINYKGESFPITEIGYQAFLNRRDLTRVVIPNTVTSISEMAFYNCLNLIQVEFGDALTTIESRAFYACTSLEEVNLGDSVTSIGEYAFSNCTALIKVDLGNSLNLIEGFTFSYCSSLQEIELPSSLQVIGNSVFTSCLSLKRINLSNVREIRDFAFYRCLALENIDIPASTLVITPGCFSWCPALESINVAAGNPAYTNNDGLVYSKDLSAIIACPGAKSGVYNIPSTVNTIASHAFDNCKYLEKVTIPASVNEIGESAFYYCAALKSIDVNSSNKNFVSIDGVLYDHDLTAVIQCPGGRTDGLELPSTVVEIKYGAFAGCEIMPFLKLPESLQSIDNYGIAYCEALTSLVIPKSVRFIGENAFRLCKSLKSIEIPEGIEKIAYSAFYQCTSLTDVVIPGSVNSIDDYVFYECSNLKSIDIPAEVIYVGVRALANCTSLESIICRAVNPPYYGNMCFLNIPINECVLYVPEESVGVYQNTYPWSDFLNIKGLSDAGVNSIQSDKEDYFRVYDLKGINVLNTVDKNSINALPSGLYIINGKKIFIGK